jgi:F-type H+-transporting ATPase subunit b
VKSLLHCLAIAATLACGAGLALAQNAAPAAALKARSAGAAHAGPARARRGRHGAAKRRVDARRLPMRAKAVATGPVARTVTAPLAPQAAQAPSAPSAPSDRLAATLPNSGADGSPTPPYALAGIGVIREPSTPGHEAHGVAPIDEGKQGTPHGEEHAEGHVEHGAGHGEHAGFSGKTFALQLLNFGVLLFLLIWFGGRAMNKALRARHEQLKGDIGEAARLRDEAMRKFEAQEQRVSDLEKEIAALRAAIRKDAEHEQARMLEAAQERAKRISDEMRFQMDRQVKEAELLLRAEVASASVKLAETMVREAVNMDDERRLAQEFVAGLDGVPDGMGR